MVKVVVYRGDVHDHTAIFDTFYDAVEYGENYRDYPYNFTVIVGDVETHMRDI